MCAISAASEAGDASTGIMSARRKYSAISDSKHVFLSQQNKSSTTRYTSMIPLNPTNVVKDNVCDKFAVIQNNSSERMSSNEREVDYYEFPYYRYNLIFYLITNVDIHRPTEHGNNDTRCFLISKNV